MKNDKHIQEELQKIAPTLARVTKRDSFEVPADYFKNISADTLKKVRHEEVVEELKSVAPLLLQVDSHQAIEVPANYFSAFGKQLIKRIAIEENTASAAINPAWLTRLNHALDSLAQAIFKPKYTLAYAGTAAVILLGVMLLVKVEQCNDLDCKMASLTDEEINTYLDSNPDSYSDEVFEAGTESKTNILQLENEMLNDVSDADLNKAIQD